MHFLAKIGHAKETGISMENIGKEVQLSSHNKEVTKESCEEKIKNILFSHGTYQIEVSVNDTESFWILLQIDQEGNIQDSLCSCNQSTEDKACSHIQTSLKHIFQTKSEPLHVRFSKSLWNQLFLLLSTRCIEKSGSLQKNQEKNTYLWKEKSKKPILEIQIQGEKAQDFLKEWVDERPEETEETSIKFSHISSEELENWQRGRPSVSLQYELSFWSDWAKWLQILEDQQQEFSFSFIQKGQSLPEALVIQFPDFRCTAYLEKNDWPKILLNLSRYNTPLSISEFSNVKLKSLRYLPKEEIMEVKSEPLSLDTDKEALLEWDDWVYKEGSGFFAKRSEPLFEKKTLLHKDISYLLRKYRPLLEQVLVNETIYPREKQVNFHLEFDKEDSLCITIYAFKPHDLTRGTSVFFDPWGYVEGKGFFLFSNLLFQGVQKKISKENMSDFIENNQYWLNQFDGFFIHLSSIEIKMSYDVLEDGSLEILHEKSIEDDSEQIIDFGAWLYVKGQGFYSKGKGSLSRKSALPAQIIKRSFVSDYIHEYKDDLEQVKGFFTTNTGLESTGLEIQLNDASEVAIQPKYVFKKWAQDQNPEVFGDFIFFKRKGFAEIPDTMKIPKQYIKSFTYPKDQVVYFVKHELSRLKPYIFSLDKRLRKPNKLQIKVKKVQRKGSGWLLEMFFSSSLGEVSVIDVYKEFAQFAPVVFSPAGMIYFEEKKFAWLCKLPKNAVDEQNGQVFLSTLDWIRLAVFEEVLLPVSNDPEEAKNINVLHGILGNHLGEMPDLSGFVSKLRPYQEVGIRWLWFLYTYGLSGFLCDDMGLGKTHQSMALVVAAMNAKKKTLRKKILIVCPASVVYHWQDLMDAFIKKGRIFMYHGTFRSPRQLKLKHDIVLTTYGILRSDRKIFAEMDFEIAIFDEMQIAKNVKSQIHMVLRNLKADMKLALTGTPIENHLTELKSLFDIILPGFFGSNQEFKDTFIAPIERGGDRTRQKDLSKLIKPFILRRKKQDVLDDLPSKVEEIVSVDLSEEQKALYDEVAISSKSILQEEGSHFYTHVFSLLNRLKQVCNHIALVKHEPENFELYPSGKWSLFVDLLEEALASEQKVVVFSQYLGMLDIMKKYLKEQKIEFSEIRGSTKNRKDAIKRFQTDPKCSVFLGSLQAAGVGIDLTAASVVIHYDRWWNPAKENQATDRVHRIGQNRGVCVYKFVTRNTVEELINNMIEKKKKLITDIVGYDSQEEMKNLDKDSLRHLLQQIYKDII